MVLEMCVRKCGRIYEPKPKQRHPLEPWARVAQHRGDTSKSVLLRCIAVWLFEATEQLASMSLQASRWRARVAWTALFTLRI